MTGEFVPKTIVELEDFDDSNIAPGKAGIVAPDGETFILSDAGAQGPPGDSAYEVAVSEGFVGTEAEWLASLVGAPGDPGAPGAPGDPGTPGADGATWRDGSGAPSDALGVDGDYYLDDATGDVYKRVTGSYTVVANIEGPAGPSGGGGSTSSLQPGDYGMKAWPFPPDVASRFDTDMEDNYSYVIVLRLSDAADLSKIGVYSVVTTAPTTLKAALYSVNGGVATREVLADDVRSLFQQLRGRVADLGASYAHDPNVDERFVVALYPTGGTMPKLARSEVDYMDCRFDDGLGALAPWGTHFNFGRVVGSPPASFNLADIIFTDRNYWITVG